MAYRTLADTVMLAHFGFLVFVALGGFLAWRFRWVVVPHAAAVGWAVLSLAGADCPLTALEDGLRRSGGERGLPGGFISHYLTGVVYPAAYLRPAQLLVAGLIAVSWLGLALRHGASRQPGPVTPGRPPPAPPRSAPRG